MPSSIKDKLAQLGARLGSPTGAQPRAIIPQKRRAPEPTPRPPLESLLPGGAWRELDGCRVYVRERRYAPGWELTPGVTLLPVEQSWAVNTCLRAQARPTGWLYLDTETTGLAGGAGTYAFLVGAGRFGEDGAFTLRQYLMDDPVQEPALLAALAREFADVDATVTYNGKSFDLPLLKTRFILGGWRPVPHASLHHLDLLHTVRRLWSGRLETCALSCVEYHILGLIRDSSDIPGYMIPQLYFDWLRSGDGEFFEGVCYHNEIDILSMAALHGKLARIIDDPEQVGKHAPALPLARLFEQREMWDEAEAQYRRALPDAAALWGMAKLCKRQKRWDEATELWGKLGEDIAALVELAKHAEHRAKDPQAALKFTARALALASRRARPDWAKLMEALEHRRERLVRKLEARSLK